MADAAGSAPEPGPLEAAEVRGWVGFELDDADGVGVGRVQGAFLDDEGGRPAWLIVALRGRGLFGSRRRATLVAVPACDCAGAGGRAWTAHRLSSLQGAPVVDASRPLLREHEIAICAHYGVGEAGGRAAEIAARPEGAVTARPA